MEYDLKSLRDYCRTQHGIAKRVAKNYCSAMGRPDMETESMLKWRSWVREIEMVLEETIDVQREE